MTYCIARYTPEFRERVLKLATHVWSTDPSVNAAYLTWKYEQNPYLDPPLLHLVVAGDEVVAMRGLHGARWLVGRPGRPVPALCVGDFVVDPSHRGRSLFARLTRAAATDAGRLGYHYLFSLSAGPAAYLQSIRAGWQDLGPLRTLRRQSTRAALVRRAHGLLLAHPMLAAIPRQIKSFAGERSALGRRAAEWRFRHLDSGARSDRPGPRRPIAIAREPRPADMAHLLERIDSTDRIRHAGDASYLAWRFGNPLSAYRFLFWDDGQLEGCLVLETPCDPLRNRVRIVLLAATDPTVEAALLESALGCGRFADIRVWSNGLADATLGVLARHGFAAIEPPAGKRYRPALLALPLGGGERLPDIGGWNLRMADSDKC